MFITSLYKNSVASLLTFLWLYSTPLFADTGSLFEGFDEEFGDTEVEVVKEEKEENLDIDGFISLSSSYNYADEEPLAGESDYRGLSRLRAKLFLEFDYNMPNEWKIFASGYSFYDFVYDINGKSGYTDDVLRASVDETEVSELYLQGTLSNNLDIKLGRQVVVWGKSDNIRVTDILNPLDNREPGMVDIENLRLPLAMTRIDYYLGEWGLSLIAIHEKRFNKNPAQGSDFNRSTAILPPEEEPTGNEFAASLNGIFSGWDISFYIASLYNDQTRRQLLPTRKQVHDRIRMIGVATNFAFGNWLIKVEAAQFDGLKYTSSNGNLKSRSDILGGLEYQGLTDQSISFEVANRHINSFEESMSNVPDYAEEDDFQTALRYTGDFINNTLQVIILASAFGKSGNGGGFQRFSAQYDWNDSLAVTAGVVNYQSGSKVVMSRIGDNDRIFLDVKYSF